MKKIFILTTASLYCIACFCQPASLDNSFNGNGKVTTAFGSRNSANAVALQTDGKIVVAGYTNVSGGDYDFALARYTTNGALDNSFAGNGKLAIGFGGDELANAIAIQQDGKIVVAGEGDNHFALARINSNGTLDNSFGGNGKIFTDFRQFAGAHAVAIQQDGKIVAAGFTNDIINQHLDFALSRYNSNGTLDMSFGSSGKVITNIGVAFGDNSDDEAFALAIQPDGKIVIAGRTSYPNQTGANFALVRYNTNGTLDNSFDTDGKVVTVFSGGIPRALAVQKDGRIIAAGEAGGAMGLVRYNQNGSLDVSFNGNGEVITDFGTALHAVAIQADGKILAAGFTKTGSGDFGVVRVNANGSFDNGFDGDGKVATGFGASETAYGIAIQSDGKIVVAGTKVTGITSDNPVDDFVLARYMGNHPSQIVAGIIAADKINIVSSDVAAIGLYPNPATGILYINKTTSLASASITITDVSGKICRKLLISGNDNTINIGMLAPGVYMAII